MKCAMVRYALDHTEDTYRLYNLETKRVVLSRDARWAEWNKLSPQMESVSLTSNQSC